MPKTGSTMFFFFYPIFIRMHKNKAQIAREHEEKKPIASRAIKRAVRDFGLCACDVRKCT